MVAGHVEQGNIQEREQIFQIGIWQVAAAKKQLDLAEMTALTETVEAFDNFIADCQDFHNAVLCLRTGFPARDFCRNSGFNLRN